MRMRTFSALIAAAVLLPGLGLASDLADAARAGDSAAVIDMLSKEIDPNTTQLDGTTALHWASRYDDVAMAGALVAAGADATARNRYDVTPLALAATNGSARMLELLLAAGADPNEVGIEGETVLMTAARTGKVEAVEVLLDGGSLVDQREDWLSQTALMWAASEGHPDVVQLLIDHGADVHAISGIRDWERQSSAEPRAKWLPLGGLAPIYFAARDGCLDCIPVLADAGANLDFVDQDGVTPMVAAIANGQYDVAAKLLDLGADVNLADNTGRSPLYATVEFNTMPESNRPAPYVLDNEVSSFELIRLLVEAGADVNRQLDRQIAYRTKLDRGNDTMLNTGTTPLVRAAKSADIPAMEFLLANGADPTLTNRSGVNALMAAAGVGTSDSDSTGRYKTEEQIIEAVRIGLNHGLDINAADRGGRTALHGAALMGYDKVIRFLAENGADLALQDGDGFSALDTALGRAGGFGFSGSDGVIRESTAAVIRELMGD